MNKKKCWLEKFLKRHKLTYKSLCGESRSVDTEMTGEWIRDNLALLIQEYEAKDVFNADETGFFFRCLPNKTHFFKNENCHGGKLSKERFTLMVACNMDGSEKLPLLVFGKSKKPRNSQWKIIKFISLWTIVQRTPNQ